MMVPLQHLNLNCTRELVNQTIPTAQVASGVTVHRRHGDVRCHEAANTLGGWYVVCAGRSDQKQTVLRRCEPENTSVHTKAAD